MFVRPCAFFVAVNRSLAIIPDQLRRTQKSYMDYSRATDRLTVCSHHFRTVASLGFLPCVKVHPQCESPYRPRNECLPSNYHGRVPAACQRTSCAVFLSHLFRLNKISDFLSPAKKIIRITRGLFLFLRYN